MQARLVVSSGLCLLALLAFAARWPGFVNQVYAERIGPLFSRGLTQVTGLAPFSLAELVVIALATWAIVPAGWALWSVLRRRRHWRNALRTELMRLGTSLVALTALFYLLWGLHYAQADLAARQGWELAALRPADRDSAIAELEPLAAALVDAANRSYVAQFGTADLGEPSALAPTGPPAVARAPADATSAPIAPTDAAGDLDRAIDAGLGVAGRELRLPASFSLSRGPAKPVALSEILSYQGVLGFYFPWTGEANFNRLVPGFELPHTIAHEKAHQRGITSEDEANFVGYLGCVMSPSAYARYAGHLFAQRQLLRALAQLDTDRASALIARRHPGVQRDVDASRAYWARYDGLARRAHARTNDTYLKLNGIEDGIASYNRSVELLLMYARANGGRIGVDGVD